jgi:phage/plasmid-associated DNA primase
MGEPIKIGAPPLPTDEAPSTKPEFKYTEIGQASQEEFITFAHEHGFTERAAGVFRGRDPLNSSRVLDLDTLALVIRDPGTGERWSEDPADDSLVEFFASRKAAGSPSAATGDQPTTAKTKAPAARPRPPVGFLDADRKPSPELLELAREFLKAPSHALAAHLVATAFGGDELIAERLALSGRADFNILDGVVHVPFDTVKKTVGQIIEKAVKLALASLEPETDGAAIKELYSLAGKARKAARTSDFINGVLSFLADAVLISGGIPWNASPECLATNTGIIDWTGPELIVRDRRPGEIFGDRVPSAAEEILNATAAPKFEHYLETLFHDAETRRSARECLALAISGKPSKTVQIWNNPEGDGAKTTTVDFLRALVPGRAVMGKNALVLWKGDPSARRFGEIELQGAMMVFFDEPSGTFDVCQIKRFTSLGTIRGEAKGQDSVEFPQTWGGFVITANELPHFFPANDGGFLSRVFVLPFSTVFCADDTGYKRRLDEGVSPARLKPAGDKTQILADLLTERPAILSSLIRTWIEVRERGGRPYESAECARAKESYRTANDTAQLFFSAYFIRDEYGVVDYSAVKDSWIEFSGESKPSMRDVVAMLVRRYPFITPAKSNGVRRLRGISQRTGNEPEENRDARDQEPDFQVRERKNEEKDIRSEKSGSQSLASLEPVAPELFRADIETPAPRSLEPIETAISGPSEPEPDSSPSAPLEINDPDIMRKVKLRAAIDSGVLARMGVSAENLGTYRKKTRPEFLLTDSERESMDTIITMSAEARA